VVTLIHKLGGGGKNNEHDQGGIVKKIDELEREAGLLPCWQFLMLFNAFHVNFHVNFFNAFHVNWSRLIINQYV